MTKIELVKLTASQVLLVRTSKLPSDALGEQLGVSENIIRRVRRVETWKNVPKDMRSKVFQGLLQRELL